MKHGFVKVAAASPAIRLADCNHNAQILASVARQACEQDGVRILLFPELCLTGATCGDLFFQNTLIKSAKNALAAYLELTADLDMVSIVGLPVTMNGKLYDCAAVCSGGTLLGIVPAQNPDSRHFATLRDSSYAFDAFSDGMQICNFGNNTVFSCSELPELKIGVCVGNGDVEELCAAGATLICRLDATPTRVGLDKTVITSSQYLSEANHCAYLYCNAGRGESTTDAAYGAHAVIAENGSLLACRKPFDFDRDYIATEIDVHMLTSERCRDTAFTNMTGNREYAEIDFNLSYCETELTRQVDSLPFIPSDKIDFETILRIQSEGLRARIKAAHADTLVLGISGGLDSTLALLVAVDALKSLDMPANKLIAITMPGFGTTSRTKNNATVLCEQLGVDFREIPIGESVALHFKDIGHDPSNHNVVYENCQARERTQVIMDVANGCNGLVVGTGDLSESVLGWATYNGDHMSNYSVNCGVPKTLVRRLVAHAADVYREQGQNALADALYDVLGTPVSPELLPANENGSIAQKTEDLVGPYELHDFFIYYALRYGFGPQKLYRLAVYAFDGAYDNAEIIKWLKVFACRFFTQQFKRSCMPDGPAVYSVTVSPRGGLCMPSDAAYALWISEIDSL
ncbi:MAG: NAD(+) synthase [Clostridia bacterium]|nr:NAD(+) synthase [Clostridia bacterium]